MPDDAGFSITEELPKLVTGNGRAQTVLNALEGALIEGGDIFRQGEGPSLRGVILREPTEKQRRALERQGIRGTRGLPLPIPLTQGHVQDFAERHFTIVRFWRNPKTVEVKELPADLPPAMATRLIEARLDGLRPLRGIAYTPILRPDGAIYAAPGYDPDSELWLTDPPAFMLPERPSETDARGYYATLLELLDEHPFDTEQDKVAGVALLMTPALRASMERAPLLIADAPYGRTGKDYLCGTASLIATARTPVVVSLGDNRDEQQKRMGHALLLGAPVVVLTNINGTLRSDELAAYLSEGGTTTRAYGTVGGAKFAPNGNTIMANGNNIEPGGDLPERHIGARQDARMEYPGERTFKHDPHRDVLADRSKYLAAIFGLARYALRGVVDHRSLGLGGLGGFDEFNRMIRAPLFALTGLDPAWRARQQINSARQERPERALIDALATLFEAGMPFSSKDIARELKKHAVLDGEDDPWDPLRCKQQELGYRLRNAKGKRGSAHRLTTAERPPGAGTTGGGAYYRLEEFSGFSGFSGFDPSTRDTSRIAENRKNQKTAKRDDVPVRGSNPEKPENPENGTFEPPAPYPGAQPPNELPKELRWMAEEGEYRPDQPCPHCRCCYVSRPPAAADCLYCRS
jgi:hypothetical protein